MTAAISSMAPAIIDKAEKLLVREMDKWKETVIEIGVNDELAICKPDSKEAVVTWKVTPTTIIAVGGMSAMVWLLYQAYENGWTWDPFGIGKIRFGGLLGPAGTATEELISQLL